MFVAFSKKLNEKIRQKIRQKSCKKNLLKTFSTVRSRFWEACGQRDWKFSKNSLRTRPSISIPRGSARPAIGRWAYQYSGQNASKPVIRRRRRVKCLRPCHHHDHYYYNHQFGLIGEIIISSLMISRWKDLHLCKVQIFWGDHKYLPLFFDV